MKVKFDTRAVRKLASVVEAIPEAVSRAEYRAVNKVTEKAMSMSRRKVASSLTLTSEYIRTGLELGKASPGKPVGTIKARRRPTKLFTYGAKLNTVAAPKAKGNPKIGLPAGRKADGVTVGVRRGGARKKMEKAFLMQLKNENGLGVFTREGGRLKHHYGPSVGQHLKLIIADEGDNIAADLEATFEAQLKYELKR